MSEPMEEKGYDAMVMWTDVTGYEAFYEGRSLGRFKTSKEAYAALNAASIPYYQRIPLEKT